MKNRKLIHSLAVLCVFALFAGLLPGAAFASDADLAAWYQQAAEFQAQYEAQAQQIQEAYAQNQAEAEAFYARLQAMQSGETDEKEEAGTEDDPSFDPKLAYEFMLLLETGELKELYFNSLTKAQQRRLILYLRELKEKGEFNGFEDFDLSLALPEDADPDSLPLSPDPLTLSPESAAAESPAELSAAEKEAIEAQFRTDYETYIFLYENFGDYADLSALPYETQLKVKACVNGRPLESVSLSEEDKAFAEQYALQIQIYRTFGENADLGGVSDDVRAKIKALVEAETAPYIPEEEEELLSPEPLTLSPESAAADSAAELPIALTLVSSLGDTVSPGDPVTLTAVVEDAGILTGVRYIWEVDKGFGYEEVPDADSATYTFPATQESLSWTWRLSVVSV